MCVNSKKEIMMKEHTNCRKEMEEDLMKVFREVSASYECRCNDEAFRRVVEHPAPRYYIDARRAHQYISPLTRGDRSAIEKLSPLKRKMYEDLFETVLRLWQNSAYCGKSLSFVLQFAVLQPAPRFYIGHTRMCQIWQKRSKRKSV